MIIAVDFDGTIVEHEFPEIGAAVPGALEWLRRFKELGAVLILWTMRNDREGDGPYLTAAAEWCKAQGVEFDHLNVNPGQASWSQSPKAYAHIYIDDAACGCPLRDNPRMGGRPFADWSIIGPAVERAILGTEDAPALAPDAMAAELRLMELAERCIERRGFSPEDRAEFRLLASRLYAPGARRLFDTLLDAVPEPAAPKRNGGAVCDDCEGLGVGNLYRYEPRNGGDALYLCSRCRDVRKGREAR